MRRISNSVLGVAYTGNGKYTPSKYKYVYGVWYNMIFRCYDPSFHKREPSYIGCEVCKQWLNFQNFANFYTQEKHYKHGWHLEKDILQKNNKIYSPETCVFVPPDINKLFVRRKLQRGDLPIGVFYEADRNKYKASMHKNNKSKFLGRYSTKEEAFYVYKNYKEKHIKTTADKYKSQISPKLYDAMMNYKVEITD